VDCDWLLVLGICAVQIDENVYREIINHRSLRHPNIIRFKEVGRYGPKRLIARLIISFRFFFNHWVFDAVLVLLGSSFKGWRIKDFSKYIYCS